VLFRSLAAYAVLRFGLELLRGDAPRPYLAGLSAAQWVSLAIAVGVAVAGAGAGYVVAAAALAVAAAVVAATAPRRRLLGAGHVAELAAALDRAGVTNTSLGLRVSAGTTDGVAHYTFSGAPAADAERLVVLVARLRRHAGSPEVVRRPGGVLHVVYPPEGTPPGRSDL